MSLRTEFSLSSLSFAQFSFFSSILLSAFLQIKKKRPRVVAGYPGRRCKVALVECKSRQENVPPFQKKKRKANKPFSLELSGHLQADSFTVFCLRSRLSHTVTKQSINKCWSRQERTEEVFVWSACTMMCRPTSKDKEWSCSENVVVAKKRELQRSSERRKNFVCQSLWLDEVQKHTVLGDFALSLCKDKATCPHRLIRSCSIHR